MTDPFPRGSAPADPPEAARRLKIMRRTRRALTALAGAPILGSALVLTVVIVTSVSGEQTGLAAFLTFGALALVAFIGAALPVVIVLLVGGVVVMWVVARLRQGARTDLDMARAAGAPAPARGEALARVWRADPEIAAALARLEAQRRDAVAAIARRRWIFVPLGAAAGALAAWAMLSGPAPSKGSPTLGAAVVVILGVGLGLLLAERTTAASAYAAAFKQTLAPRLLARFGKFDVRLGANTDMSRLAAVEAATPTVDPDLCRIEDSIVGVYRGREVRIDEYRMFARDSKGRIDRNSFSCAGILLSATAERAWAGRLLALAPGSNAETWTPRVRLDAVRLEDAVFADVYRVWASDQIFARATLTPGMMQAMLAVTDDTGFLPPTLAINGAGVVLFAPFANTATTFLEAEATAADALGQAALQMEGLTQLFGVLDMLFAAQRLRMGDVEGAGADETARADAAQPFG
jgi:hypothetical protein